MRTVVRGPEGSRRVTFCTRLVLLLLVLLPRGPVYAQGMDANAVLVSIDQKAQAYAKVAMDIWSFAEVGYQETKSSALLQSQLQAAGFTVKAGVDSDGVYGDLGRREAGHRHHR
jgi:hypothetical protein